MFKRGLDFLRRQRRPYKVNLGRSLIQRSFRALTQQYRSIYIISLGADPLELGLVNSIAGLVSSFISIQTGWVSDKYGLKRLLLTSARAR